MGRLRYLNPFRLARLLKVPLVRSVEPEHVSFSVPVPQRRGAARRASS